MPKLLCARAAVDPEEERKIRKLAASRHAPGDWIRRARMVARSWDGLRTGAIATELGCHPQTVRERLARFNAEGLDGLSDRPGAGRKRRLTEVERGRILALARRPPRGDAFRRPSWTSSSGPRPSATSRRTERAPRCAARGGARREATMRIGTVFPQTELGDDPVAIRD